MFFWKINFFSKSKPVQRNIPEINHGVPTREPTPIKEIFFSPKVYDQPGFKVKKFLTKYDFRVNTENVENFRFKSRGGRMRKFRNNISKKLKYSNTQYLHNKGTTHYDISTGSKLSLSNKNEYNNFK